jgi:phytoene synthase
MIEPERIRAAYAECERITRRQAGNFSWGIRLLPDEKRRALSAVYAMARRIDDISDGQLPAVEKLRLLRDARELATDPASHPDDAIAIALTDSAARLPIPLAAFGELVDGCEMDVLGRTYDTIDDLVGYCSCVAGSIGRLSVGVFGHRGDPDRIFELADALGVALQLTNILRDLREDHYLGRTYLPKQDLEAFDCTLETLPDGSLDPQDGALAELIRFEATRAQGWYERGIRLLPELDRRSLACCTAMAGIYRALLDRIAADPTLTLRGRTSVPTRQKVGIAVRALVRTR